MTNLLMMVMSLPEAVMKLSHTYPHLRSLYGNTQVPIYLTRVLCLLNLFDEEELVLDGNYSQLLADIEEEVEAYGRVEKLIVPRREARPRPPEAPKKEEMESPAAEAAALAAYERDKKLFNLEVDRYLARQNHPLYGGIGRVFVMYETVEEAAYAQQQMAGKLFGGRTVVTSFLYEDLLQEEGSTKEYSGVAADEEEEVEELATY
ncbi:unnamed protein product [Phytomonas sp. Hart1]|nr:unnamed protein product [Phytomonas sp. Hart1]|eukprot:CCW69739.1 unnamed protein product [Phytomonas sp. isolate Hart1]